MTVIVPTHDHPATLDLAVSSVLGQTVASLDVVVIGDGVADETRDVMRELTEDRRVRFLDQPKSPSRAERSRHRVLSQACTPYVCYLGDDDLMLPGHVETMIDLLGPVDFAHPLPVYVDQSGGLRAHPTDIGRSACIAWHLHPGRNSISLTGVAHRLDAYRRLPLGWQEAPAGRWSDHFMWEQWFRTPGLRFVTGKQATVLKFDASLRCQMTPAERREELLAWIERSRKACFAEWLAVEAANAFHQAAIQGRLDVAALEDRMATNAQETAALVESLGSTRTWRLHHWLEQRRLLRRIAH